MGVEIAKDTFKFEDANEEGFGYVQHKKEAPGLTVTFEIWIRWKDKKVVLVVLFKHLLKVERKRFGEIFDFEN